MRKKAAFAPALAKLKHLLADLENTNDTPPKFAPMTSLKWLSVVSFMLVLLVAACGKTQYRQGQALYVQHCANCHMESGKGLGALIPPLAASDWLAANQNQLACLIKNGMEGPIVVNDTTYNQLMPGVEGISEFQIVNIVNYINHAWGNDYGLITVAAVRQALEACP